MADGWTEVSRFFECGCCGQRMSVALDHLARAGMDGERDYDCDV